MKKLAISAVCVTIAVVLFARPTFVSAQHHHGHSHGHSHGHQHVVHGHDVHVHHSDHAGHHYVVPHVDQHHHHGTYWVDSGQYYYQPQTFASNPGTHVVAKPVAVEYGGYSHVDDLAGRLQRLSNELCLDMHYNYAHNPGFAATYREAYQIMDTAKYIHAKEHQQDRAEVARRLADLDPLMHHVNSEVAGWSRESRREIGQAGIKGKLEMVESTLHHLMNDVGIRPDEVHANSASGISAGEVAPPPAPVLPPTVTTPPPSLQ